MTQGARLSILGTFYIHNPLGEPPVAILRGLGSRGGGEDLNGASLGGPILHSQSLGAYFGWAPMFIGTSKV